ncbi:hypothetical protein H8356DRAFT_1362276 [Neocallimastix lanati (nom. inval.)]|nr:hypothetical protein H8356DRAFT_1362276 [Neocallimastix sp. JGI-2020a]
MEFKKFFSKNFQEFQKLIKYKNSNNEKLYSSLISRFINQSDKLPHHRLTNFKIVLEKNTSLHYGLIYLLTEEEFQDILDCWYHLLDKPVLTTKKILNAINYIRNSYSLPLITDIKIAFRSKYDHDEYLTLFGKMCGHHSVIKSFATILKQFFFFFSSGIMGIFNQLIFNKVYLFQNPHDVKKKCLFLLFNKIWDGIFPDEWNPDSFVSISIPNESGSFQIIIIYQFIGIFLINVGLKILNKKKICQSLKEFADYAFSHGIIRPENPLLKSYTLLRKALPNFNDTTFKKKIISNRD